METVSRIYSLNIGTSAVSEVRGIDNGELTAISIRPEIVEFSAELIKVHDNCLEAIKEGKSTFFSPPLFFSPLSSPVENLEFPYMSPPSDPKRWKVSVFVGDFSALAANVNTARQRITTLKKEMTSFEIDAESCCLYGEWYVFFASSKPSWIFSAKNSLVEGEGIVHRIPIVTTTMGSWEKDYSYSPRQVVRHKGHLWESKGFGYLEPGIIDSVKMWEFII